MRILTQIPYAYSLSAHSATPRFRSGGSALGSGGSSLPGEGGSRTCRYQQPLPCQLWDYF